MEEEGGGEVEGEKEGKESSSVSFLEKKNVVFEILKIMDRSNS